MKRIMPVAAALLLSALPLRAADGELVGKPAPAFTLQTVEGTRSLSLAELRGQVVVLDFWASWCAPCRRSMPHLAALPSLLQGVQVVGVSVDDERRSAAEFLRRNRIRMIALHDADKAVAARYEVSGMPCALLIDRKGRVRSVYAGYTMDDMEEIESDIRRLLEEPS